MREGKCLCGMGAAAVFGFLLVLGTCAWAADGEPAGALAMREAEKSLMASLEPLPEKGTGARLGAIESTLSNPFWITMEKATGMRRRSTARLSTSRPRLRRRTWPASWIF